MKKVFISRQKGDKFIKIFAGLIILIGVALRTIVYIQNRNLFIDEANVARNIYERGFLELLRPLDYEQYATPIFLWITKMNTLLFGYSEYAYRIYPFFAGTASLFVLLLILKQITSFRSLWYPLFLMATGFIFVRYSTELKQYAGDGLVTLLLIFIALKTDIVSTPGNKFAMIWVVAGSIAIWLSMPSVFVLAGAGGYYFYNCVHTKKYKKILLLLITGCVWLLQFLLYYLLILKKQANSDYLQNYHTDFFMFLIPNSIDHMKHNWYLFRDQIATLGGDTVLAIAFNTILLLAGIIRAFVKKTATAIFLTLPIVGVYIASGFHQYAFVDRLMLFIMPVFLILMACGLEGILRIRFVFAQIAVAIIAAICIYNYNRIDLVYKPYRFEELSAELNFLKKKSISGAHLYVHHGARPAFIYYTQIHPEKSKWASLRDAHLLWWDVNYDSVAEQVKTNEAFIFSSVSGNELEAKKNIIGKHLQMVNDTEGWDSRCFVYIYSKPGNK